MARRVLAVAVAVAATLSPFVVAVSAASAGGGTCHDPVAVDERSTLVEIKRSCFLPTVVRVAPGETVVFRNTDPPPHTVTGLAGTIGGHDQLTTGEQVSHRFDEPGTYPYHCILHPGMVGAVVVGDGVPAAGSATTVAPPATLDARPAAARGADDGGSSGWAPAALVTVGLVALVVAYGAGRRGRRTA